MQEKGVMLQDNSLRGPNNKSGAKALMNTIMQLRYISCQIIRTSLKFETSTVLNWDSDCLQQSL